MTVGWSSGSLATRLVNKKLTQEVDNVGVPADRFHDFHLLDQIDQVSVIVTIFQSLHGHRLFRRILANIALALKKI